MENRTAIAIDWLQCFCKKNTTIFENYKGIYTIEKKEYSTRHFKDVYIVSLLNDEVATIQTSPFSKIITTGDSIIKFNNKYLYQNDLYVWTNYILKELGLQFISIGRLDISIDFNSLFGNKAPQKFIQDFTSGKVIKHGKSKVQLMGFQSDSLVYDYMKFGSTTSELSYYLYNKSKELREVKNKPYIIDFWHKNNITTGVDVWRLEFSIKKSQKDVIDTDTGEAFKLNDLSIIIRKNFESVVKKLVEKKFKFSSRFNWEKTKEKYRVSAIKLFSFTNETIDLVRVSEKKCSNRMDKIFIKKLENLTNDFQSKNVYFQTELDTVAAYFRRTRGLIQYAT